jgi:hypothetical protein
VTVVVMVVVMVVVVVVPTFGPVQTKPTQIY